MSAGLGEMIPHVLAGARNEQTAVRGIVASLRTMLLLRSRAWLNTWKCDASIRLLIRRIGIQFCLFWSVDLLCWSVDLDVLLRAS